MGEHGRQSGHRQDSPSELYLRLQLQLLGMPVHGGLQSGAERGALRLEVLHSAERQLGAEAGVSHQ